MERQRASSGTEWESVVGYSRAVRRGAHVFVSGTTATDAGGNVVGVGNPGQQMRQALSNVESALYEAGGSLDDVVRTRIYVVDIDQLEVIGRVHGEVFGDIRPATSMVEVRRLIDPDMLVEIEAVALVEEE
jgi:enamine deaminase RidA (YjgF/YER057c/UK114 family)